MFNPQHIARVLNKVTRNAEAAAAAQQCVRDADSALPVALAQLDRAGVGDTFYSAKLVRKRVEALRQKVAKLGKHFEGASAAALPVNRTGWEQLRSAVLALYSEFWGVEGVAGALPGMDYIAQQLETRLGEVSAGLGAAAAKTLKVAASTVATVAKPIVGALMPVILGLVAVVLVVGGAVYVGRRALGKVVGG